jgi:hypothetical protein
VQVTVSPDAWRLIEAIGVFGGLYLGFRSERKQREEQHIENADRLSRIETMIEPMWEAFKKSLSGEKTK